MERNGFWIFLGILVAFGIAIQSINDPAPSSTKLKRMSTRYQDIEDAGMAEGADARAGRIEGVLRASQTKSMQVAGYAPAVAPALSLPTNPLGQTADGKAGNKAVAKKDDKTKKKDDKKKKKKKKKTVEGKPEDPTTPESDDESDSDDDVAASGSGKIAEMANGALVPPPPRNNDIPESQREWEVQVLTEPDFKATEKLVKFYQSNMVSAEIYYNVVRQMLDDKRAKMRQLGLVALGATPSAQSFVELALFSQDESLPALKTQAQGYMIRYTELAYVRYLAGAMQVNDVPQANLDAIRVFRLALDRHLKVAEIRNPAELSGESDQSSETPGAPSSEDTQVIAGVVKKRSVDVALYFRPFVAILDRLQMTYNSRDLKSAAVAALNSLRGLLPTVASQETQPETSPESAGSEQPVPTAAAAPRSSR